MITIEKPVCITEEKYKEIYEKYDNFDAEKILEYITERGYQEPEKILESYQGMYGDWEEFAREMINDGYFENQKITTSEAVEELKKNHFYVQNFLFANIKKESE